MALEDAKTQVDQAFTRDDARGLSYENAFGGATSFLRRRYAKDLAGVDLAVTGIPFDQAVTNRPGTRFGPRAIREASTLQPYDPPYGWGYDPLSLLSVVDHGDMAFDYANIREVPARIEAHVGKILDAGAAPVTLGGDHFITLPILRAVAARRGPVALIQFDAHSDTWVDDDPDRIDHGTFLYKAIREGVVDPASSVSIGIRTENPDTLGVTILDAPGVHRDGIDATQIRIREAVADRPVYVTFDIDANGIVNVSAKDKATGKEQQIRIQASGGLSDNDIESMVKDAERFAEEDKKRREAAEARNQADNLVHATEKQVQENGDKIDASLKSDVEAAIAETKTALEGDDVDAINAKAQALTEVAMKMGQQIYEKEQASGGGDAAAADAAATQAEDDDVVDAEFSEVDDGASDDSGDAGRA